MFSSKKYAVAIIACSVPLLISSIAPANANDDNSNDDSITNQLNNSFSDTQNIDSPDNASSTDSNENEGSDKVDNTEKGDSDRTGTSPKDTTAVDATTELEKIEQMKEQISEIDKKKSALSEELKQILNSVSQYELEITALQKQISDLDKQMLIKEDEISKLKTDIENIENNIKSVQIKLDEQKQALGSSLAFMYENRNDGFFQLFFQSENLGDFFKSIDFMKLMIDSNEQIHNEIKELEASLSTKKTKLEINLNELNSAVDSLEGDAAALEEKKAKQIELLLENQAIEEAKVKEIEGQEAFVEELNSKINEALSNIAANNIASKDVPLTPNQKLSSPLKTGSYVITSLYGYRIHPVYGYSKFHNGIDMAGPSGTPIYAAGNGTVIDSGPASGFGNWIVIRHDNGLYTIYGHMENGTLYAKSGQRVQQGQLITRIGNAGTSTGPHLHFSVATDYSNGKFSYINPLQAF